MRAAEGERDSVAPTQLEAHHLAEVLDFRPDQGIIRLHEQRVVLLSAAAMGLLRKELIDTLDLETARRLFLRFGYVDGYHDAVSLRDRGKWSDRFEGLRAGSVLHRLAGIARPEIVQLEHEAKSGRFHGEVVWHDSYVAKQHVHHYGKSDTPVCWSLVGYAAATRAPAWDKRFASANTNAELKASHTRANALWPMVRKAAAFLARSTI